MTRWGRGPQTPSTMDALALYVHWPFCLSKCPYCDFNSHVREAVPSLRYGAALIRELEGLAARLGRRRLTSIFFGGGTPSLMPPEVVHAVISRASALFEPAEDLEITLEANPTSVEAGRLRAFREAGVDRCSLGVQALDDVALAGLGRQHSAAEAVAGLEIARAVFARVSFDLIYARPGQEIAAWRAELRRALAMAADHLSLYQLTIEPGTRYESLARRGEIVLPDDDTAAALYDATGEEAARSGLLPYEVSNYAREGAESRHNLAYWRYGDYAGIGAGAHGRLTGDGVIRATRRFRSPERWLDAVERTGDGTEDEEEIEPRARGREMLLMGLRLSEGVDSGRFEARTGLALESALEMEFLKACVSEDYLAFDGQVLRATASGRRLLDAILPRLIV